MKVNEIRLTWWNVRWKKNKKVEMKIRNPIWTKHTDSHLMEISNGFFLVGSSQNCLERKTTGGWNGRRRRTSVVCTAEVPRLMVLRTVHRLFLYGRPVHPASGARLGAKPEVKRSSRERKRRRRRRSSCSSCCCQYGVITALDGRWPGWRNIV